MKTLVTLVMAVAMSSVCRGGNDYQVSNVWGNRPLGPKIESKSVLPPKQHKELTSNRKINKASGDPVKIIAAKQPLALIVVGNKEVQAAVEDLQDLLEQASGVKLPIVQESELNAKFSDGRFAGKNFESLIFVGNSRTASGLGIDGSKLPPEGYQIKTIGNALFLVGNDVNAQTGDKLNGSYFAVNDFLESIGFAFLWPGKTGTVVPRLNDVSISPCDIQDFPAIKMRIVRNGGAGSASDPRVDKLLKTFSPDERGDFIFHSRMLTGMKNQNLSPKIMGEYFPESYKWINRMRIGGSANIQGTHSFGGWYERYVKTHPEWFALQPDGTRIQHPPREQFCVSNPEYIKAVTADRIAQFKNNPKLSYVSISPEDGSAKNLLCMCENCRKFDPVNEKLTPKNAYMPEYVSMTDRYFDFFSKVADGIHRECPDKQVACVAYYVYRDAPLYINVSPNLTVGFVGLTYDDRQKLTDHRAQWNAWAAKAEKLYLRPNALHAGHGALLVYPTELGNDIKHCYQTGMVGADFDSIIHNWATQGINYYILAKLLWDPSQNINALIDDYSQKGFGPAAAYIRDYFRHAETLTNQLASHETNKAKGALTAEEDDANAKVKFPIWEKMHIYYDQAHLAPLREDLARAKAAAAGDETVLQRIAFLESGLNYTGSQAEAFAIYNKKVTDPEKIKDILQRRNKLFNQLYCDYPFSVNIPYICWRESNLFNKYLKSSSNKLKRGNN